MKPIQKGLAIIAGATLITVFAISFLGEGSKNEEQVKVANADTKIESTESQTQNVMNAKGSTAVSEQTKANSVVAKNGNQTETAPGLAAKANFEEMASSKQADNDSYVNSERVSTSNTPAPPGPFHKNTLAASTPAMPSAPAAPSSDNVELPPPPMPQVVMDAPQSPVAPEPNISKPDFVATRQEMGVVLQEQPVALTEGPEAPVKEIQQQNTPEETAKVVESAEPEVQAEVVAVESAEAGVQAEVVEVESAEPIVQAEIVEAAVQAEVVEVESAAPEVKTEVVAVESAEAGVQAEVVEVESAAPEVKTEVVAVESVEAGVQAEVVEVESAEPIVQAEIVEAAVLPTKPSETSKKSSQEAAVTMNENTDDSALTVETTAAEQVERSQGSQTIDKSAMQQPQLEMPARPMPPMMPGEIQQSGINMQPMPMYQGQPRVIYVPVPVYPYQHPAMNQQWGEQMLKMRITPPQPPVMGETAPIQEQ